MRKASDNSQALAAFVARKSEIAAILARLTRLSNDHFDAIPEEINWADVGTLDSYGTVQTLGGSCRFGKGWICTGDPVKPMPQPGPERAIVDRATNLQQQIGAPP
jgi:hypothetical protein